jgi:PhnB protein
MSAVINEASHPMPEVRGGVVPYLQVEGAAKASEFYQRAFAATEVYRHALDEQGRTMHIHLYLNGSSLMLSDFYPEYGHPPRKPAGFDLTIDVKEQDDIDTWWNRALAAGAEVVLPLQEMFWGARYGQVRDPFGVVWAMNQQIRR